MNETVQEGIMFEGVTFILSGVIYGYGGDGEESNNPDDELILADGVSPSTSPGPFPISAHTNDHTITTTYPFAATSTTTTTSRRNSTDDTLILLEHPTWDFCAKEEIPLPQTSIWGQPGGSPPTTPTPRPCLSWQCTHTNPDGYTHTSHTDGI